MKKQLVLLIPSVTGAADAPNDALVVENTRSGQLETAVTELFDPVYYTTANTLTYTVIAEKPPHDLWVGR